MIRSSRSARLLCAALSLTCLMGMAACSGHKKKNAPSSQTPTPTPPPTTTSAAPKPKPPTVNPLTGSRKLSKNGVVAVKIDDTANGRPQVNIDLADIVYIEEVEGGLTRLLAVYNTHLPTVEAVRSVRAGDPQLVGQYGPIAYVASGGAPYPLQTLDQSNLKSSINDRGGPGFARDGSRGAPYNLTANLALAAKTLKAPKAKNIGLTWLRSVKRNSRPSAPTVQTRVGGTPVRFEWNTQLQQYVRVIDGATQHQADGKPVATPNVIVQFCRVTVDPRDVDVVGNPSQFTHTVGSGKVAVFRNGRKVAGTWTRSKLGYGTHLKDAHGKPIALVPGGAWVVLVATNAPLSSS
jgi:DUF3048 family protein